MPMDCRRSSALLTPAARPFRSMCARSPVAAGGAAAAAAAAPHAAGDSTDCRFDASLDCCAVQTCSVLLVANSPLFARCESRLAALRMAMARRSWHGRWIRATELSSCPVFSAAAQRYCGCGYTQQAYTDRVRQRTETTTRAGSVDVATSSRCLQTIGVVDVVVNCGMTQGFVVRILRWVRLSARF